MYIHELVIEITRRCNMHCEHCLRGEEQNKDISDETVDKLLDNVTSIDIITFTGGEPSLAVDRIRYITKQIMQRRIAIQGFYVVTNGKVASVPLASALLELYMLIDYPEEGLCTLSISRDQYHENEVDDVSEAESLYSGLTFFSADHRRNQIKVLINEGRAYDHGIGDRDLTIEPLALGYDPDGTLSEMQGVVYVNALGDVIPSCDLSFESQDKFKLGNVHTDTLATIVAREVPTH